MLSPEDEDALAEIRDLLSPLARATKELCADKVCQLSKVIPVLKNLRRVSVMLWPEPVSTYGLGVTCYLSPTVNEMDVDVHHSFFRAYCCRT